MRSVLRELRSRKFHLLDRIKRKGKKMTKGVLKSHYDKIADIELFTSMIERTLPEEEPT